jgi:PqqD family protein of HPr-rel-A system
VTDRQSDGGGAVSLAVAPGYRPLKRADVLELDMGDGIVLYDPESKLVHHLNPSASLLWQLADGEASLEQLVEEASQELQLDRSELHEQFSGLIAELDALGVLIDASDPSDTTRSLTDEGKGAL